MKITVFVALWAAFAAGAQAQVGADQKGCADSPLLTRMPGCRISLCRAADFGTIGIHTKSHQEPEMLEGATQEIHYQCERTVNSTEIAGNARNALQAAGYQLVFQHVYGTGSRHWLTVRKGPQWVAVTAANSTYRVFTVLTKQMEQAMQASAAAWAEQINSTGRVSVYGIQFDTAKATIRPESEKVLAELLTLLQKNATWHMVVAGHTDQTGTDAINAPLSAQRAEAVVTWLASRGVDRTRLTALGFGARRPLGDNATEEGRALNRRVDLIKLY